MTHYLKFNSEEESFLIAKQLNLTSEIDGEEKLIRFTHDYAIDVIGEISKPNPDNPEETILLSGWHVNFQILNGAPLPEILQPYVITPHNPIRVFL